MDETWRPGPRVTGDDGVELAVWDLGGDGPPLVLLHGTGFHARVWEPVAGPLRAAHHVWALDQRGHGASGHAADGLYTDWDHLARDLHAVADVLAPAGGLLGAGHSLGGAVLLRAEQLRPGTCAALYCYEPVVIPAAVGSDAPPALSALARQRRAVFPSRRAARDNFAGKPPFAAMDGRVLDAYVAHGFVERADGTVELACPPAEEASFYEGALHSGIWERLDEVGVPVTVAAGGDDAPPADLAAAIAERLPTGHLERYADLDHFGPMTDPERIGKAIAAAVAGDGRR